MTETKMLNFEIGILDLGFEANGDSLL